jgi:hypothetical protein
VGGVGVLRLRSCFASRNGYSAQDDIHKGWIISKETGPEEEWLATLAALVVNTLSGDQRFQGDAIGDHNRRAALLNEALLFEAGEEPAYRFS